MTITRLQMVAKCFGRHFDQQIIGFLLGYVDDIPLSKEKKAEAKSKRDNLTEEERQYYYDQLDLMHEEHKQDERAYRQQENEK